MGLAIVRVMPSPVTGTRPLTMLSSVSWSLCVTSPSCFERLATWDCRSLTSAVSWSTCLLRSCSSLDQLCRTALRGSVCSRCTNRHPANPTATQITKTISLVAHSSSAEVGWWVSRASVNSGSIGRLVRSSISRSESSSVLRRRWCCPDAFAGSAWWDSSPSTDEEKTARRRTGRFSVEGGYAAGAGTNGSDGTPITGPC